jgi:hypothetical protein
MTAQVQFTLGLSPSKQAEQSADAKDSLFATGLMANQKDLLMY